MIHLSKRLRAVVDYIHGTVLADIGCDHGYVCVQSVLENRVQKAYACDVAKGPLENARSTILNEGLDNSIFCMLMNGIENLPDDVDTIVISGMGSSLMIQILESSLDKVKLHSHLVCCPHKDVHLFREFVSHTGFEIIREKVIFEDSHYYPIMELLYTGCSYSLSNEELFYGKNVDKNDVYNQYIYAEFNKWNSIYTRLPDSKKESMEDRMNALKALY